MTEETTYLNIFAVPVGSVNMHLVVCDLTKKPLTQGRLASFKSRDDLKSGLQNALGNDLADSIEKSLKQEGHYLGQLSLTDPQIYKLGELLTIANRGPVT